ncbi:hypothetical protein BDF20DRAFT_847322 [Mycotypha africana]|uniref:uncharacterized protein n=1 Tax=Mycotypha africana TaxID=64632 RepID=UPI0023010E06|nr:uncharacterized protein BDF20DRAFT_847322 [Mycotypha africana]KAI8991936.1 hypothetical protein BDF20DRAFT_847322 [Mycotypha africana]
MQQQRSGMNGYYKLAILCTVTTLFIVFTYKLGIVNVQTLMPTTDNSAITNFITSMPLTTDTDTSQALIDTTADTADLRFNTVNTTITEEECNCDVDGSTAAKFIRYGENTPLFVPESLPPMEQDILDKVNTNKVDGTLLMTIAARSESDNDRYDVYNWIRLSEAAKEDKFLVFVLDEALYLHMVVSGYEDRAVLVPSQWYIHSLPSSSASSLVRLEKVKSWILQRMMYTDVNVLYLDVHALLLRQRTREYMQTLIDIRGDTKMIATVAIDKQQQQQQQQQQQHGNFLSTDVMLFKRNVKSLKRLIANVIQILNHRPHLTEQQAFNEALEQQDLHLKTGMLLLLDRLHFPTGEDYFEKNLSESNGVQPYIVQADPKIADDAQRDLLKKHNLWKVDEGSIDGVTRQVHDMLKRKYSNPEDKQITSTKNDS